MTVSGTSGGLCFAACPAPKPPRYRFRGEAVAQRESRPDSRGQIASSARPEGRRRAYNATSASTGLNERVYATASAHCRSAGITPAFSTNSALASTPTHASARLLIVHSGRPRRRSGSDRNQAIAQAPLDVAASVVLHGKLQPDLPGPGVEPARSPAAHAHLSDPRRRQGLALRRARRAPPRHPARRPERDPQPSRERVADRRSGRSHPQSLGRRL